MSRSNFTKFLKSLTEDELRKELTQLYSSIKEVKLYYSMELGSDKDRQKIYDKAKVDIWNLYYIRNKPRKRPRIAKIKSLLKDLEKIAVFTHETVDINLFTCITSLSYLMRRPSVTKASYNNCIETFTKACLLIQKAGLYDEFKKTCQSCVIDSQEILFLEGELQHIYNETYHGK